MKMFCPSCDAVVDVTSGDDRRCPQCHRTLAATPDASASPTAPNKGKAMVIGSAVLVAAAVGAGMWLTVCQSKPPAVTGKSASAPDKSDLAGRLQAAGLKGDRAVAPGTADAALTTAAKDSKDIKATLQALVAPGKLQLVSPTTRRRHPVENTAELWSQLAAGKARPVHSVEAAFLTRAMLLARGEEAEFVTETAGVQSPLLLSRTRLGVRSKGQILEPLASQPMQTPAPVSLDQASVWWLILRAHGERVNGEFAKMNEDLKAADTLLPGDPGVMFARGVADLDQGMAEPGVAKCEQALAKKEDPLARLFLAEVAVALEQPVKALQRVEEALKAAPDLPEGLVTKGILAAQRISTVPDGQKPAQKAEAKALFEKALQRDPKVLGARAGLAQLRLLDQDEAGATALLQDAVTKDKDLESALVLSDLLRRGKKPAEAIKVLEGLGLQPEDERYVMALLQSYMAAEQPEKAMATVEEAHKLSPASRQIALMRADLLRQSGRTAEAIVALEPLKTGADGERMGLLQAQLYLQDHQMDKAIKLLEPIVAGKPTERDPTALLLMAYAGAGQKDPAMKVKALALAKKAMDAKLLKGGDVAGLMLQGGDPVMAEQVLTEAVKVAPEVDTVGTLAMIYTASGRKDQAAKLREEVGKVPVKGKELQEMVDKAVTAAQAELDQMKKGAAMPQGMQLPPGLEAVPEP